ncbi:MAG: class I SAM-dependent methyltransferase [Polyangiales bacterium]
MSNTYDELPYADYCFERSHPERLAAIAVLCGRRPPYFARCRVLELGCARGANLLPMALDLPGSELVGVDLSAAQIDEATRRAEALGITHARFLARSITDLDASLGDFDFIVCHGVYSWVPAEVRAAVLRVCRERLRPGGVAYVSYNALPGWNALRTLREYLAEHAPEGPALQRVVRARQALALLSTSLRGDPSPWAAWMRDELSGLAEVEDAYLFHEYLEAVNDAFTLREFDAAARAAGLAHLGDADLRVARPMLSPGAGDPVALSQSIDYTKNRRFRSALLVREEEGPGRADPACVARLYLATRAEPLPANSPALTEEGEARFEWEGGEVTLRDPWMKRAMQALAEADRRPVAFAELAGAVGARLGLPRPKALRMAAAKAGEVLELLFDGAVTPHLSAARYAGGAGLRPLGAPLARLQAQSTDVVTTLRHTRVELPEDPHAVLRLLDGTRDREAIVAALPWSLRDKGRAARCEDALDWLASNALLLG